MATEKQLNMFDFYIRNNDKKLQDVFPHQDNNELRRSARTWASGQDVTTISDILANFVEYNIDMAIQQIKHLKK